MNINTRYAKGKDGNLVEAIKGMNIDQRFTCGGCGEEVRAYAINTKVQAAHFRHVVDSENRGCGDNESYIHWISKELFAEAYRDAKKFTLEYRRFNGCVQAKDDRCREIVTQKVDLKTIFPYIKVEVKDECFIPDCMIHNNNGDKIYIEIKHTSAVSQEKIRSGVRIIEIEVKRENDIVRLIVNNNISEESSAIKIYGFDRNRLKTATYDCRNRCINEVRTSSLSKPKPIKRIYDEPKPQERPKITGTQVVQLFRPKRCFHCDNHPVHYMNVGRVLIDNDSNVSGIEDEIFKDEITITNEFSIAKRVDEGSTNSYSCPSCGNWLANNRLLKGITVIYEDEKVIRC